MIGFYEREHYYMSNFSSFAIEMDGELWMTSEHAYQALKFSHKKHKDIIKKVRDAPSAHEAKKIARKYADSVRPDWDKVKVYIMEDICRLKLHQHPYIQKKLKETGDEELVEDSPKDAFWGWGPHKDGENHLGKIWMKLRAELS